MHLAPVEVLSALTGERWGGRLRPARFEHAKSLWARMWQDMTVVFADEQLISAAAESAERHRLRGYDAVQLVAAEQSGCDVFLCSDVKLLGAAHDNKLAVVNLNEVP